ncbi:GNAT family N-acetyltransferase [Lusitaniella coriacea LEGE 07157]|uniref:GNAT family N-acetyltransferase n=1 Tax=Lusitaniella coriacea LEGE 07157 TaxID=945747 RepID=A0A8J7DX76_9CYAN|nr:GNAT family N-acetyltransferase [Lusitaniella coriacea]MBE9116802.1 GNAT family N-acetyltransferase [Lusitaniella coriacea LEGE 07157]
MHNSLLLPGYQLQVGSVKDRALLLQFLSRSYQEVFPDANNFSHLVTTVKRYLTIETPLWWVVKEDDSIGEKPKAHSPKVACLWMGNAIDQVWGNRYSHIFLLYVRPEYRREGIGSALMLRAQEWAISRGDCQIGLQVFPNNENALKLYRKLGYETQSLLMIKKLEK